MMGGCFHPYVFKLILNPLQMVYELLPSILDPAPLLPASKPSLSSIDAAGEDLHVSNSGSCQEAPVSSSILSSVEEDIPASPPPFGRGEFTFCNYCVTFSIPGCCTMYK